MICLIDETHKEGNRKSRRSAARTIRHGTASVLLLLVKWVPVEMLFSTREKQ